MRLLYALLFLICMLLPSSVLAEYYQYRDQNGVLRFTDNLADVPEDQRQQIKSYTESEVFVMTEEESLEYLQDTSVQEETGEDMEGAYQSEENGEDMDDADQSEETETGRDDSLAQLKKLNQMKAALDEEFAELMEEKQVLLQYKDSKKNMSIKEAKAYQKKVTLLNQRITDFEERRQAYKKEADAFNAQAGK
jgi:hypothetical protein